jgi:TonB dependent receptor
LEWSRAHSTTVGASFNRRQIDLNLDFLDPRCTEFDPNCDFTSAARVANTQSTPQNSADLYASHRWHINPAFTATGGLRASRNAALGRTEAEPRLGLEWNWSKATQLSLGLGRHNQAPPPDQSLPGIGNPALAHLKSNHQVVGISQTLAGGWSWRSELYSKTFTGYAVSDPRLNYRNGGSGTAQGLELLVKKDSTTSKLSGFFSLSVSKARRKNDSTGERFRFDYDQPVIASLVGQYKLSDGWIFGGKASYHTGAPYTPVTSTGQYPDGRVRPIYGAINSQRVPAYFRLDLRVDRKFSPALTGYAELINATARKNVAGYSYSPDYRTREEVYQLPLLPSVGLQYSF